MFPLNEVSRLKAPSNESIQSKPISLAQSGMSIKKLTGSSTRFLSRMAMDFLQTAVISSPELPWNEPPQFLDKYSREKLSEDIHALLEVVGFKLFFNQPEEDFDDDSGKENLEEPDDAPVQPRVVPPKLTPQELQPLEDIYHLKPSLLAGYEGEREDEMPFYREVSQEPAKLRDLALLALGDAFNREDDKFHSYLNTGLLPPQALLRAQELLTTDVPVLKAALAIDDGIFWKRLLKKKYPYIHCAPKIQKTTYKSVFLQEWLSDYISELEPRYVDYNEVKKTVLAVSLWILHLDIRNLKPCQFYKTDPPKRKFPLKEWDELDKETCFMLDPYPERIDIKKILKCLRNLRTFSICYGFENFERDPTFQHARISFKDIEKLGKGILMAKKLVSLKLHKSAIYSQDLKNLCKTIKHAPLKKIEITSCFIDDNGVLSLADLLKHHKYLQVLNLSRNKLTDIGAYYLGMALAEKEGMVRSLELSFNKIGNVGGMFLGLMLAENESLGCLKLAGCGLNGPGAQVIAAGLHLNTTLLQLDLTANLLDEPSGRAILDAVIAHPRIEDVDVGECDLPKEAMERIDEAAQAHKNYNRAYYIASKWTDGEARGRRYRLEVADEGQLKSEPFPSYPCPGQDASPEDTNSEGTAPGGYDQHPGLPAYERTFAERNQKAESTRTYLDYLQAKMDKDLRKGIGELYKNGAPLLKLLNLKNKINGPQLVHEY